MRARRVHSILEFDSVLCSPGDSENFAFLDIKLHLHVAAHSWSVNISFWSNLASFGQLIFRYMALSSANNLIFDVRCCSMSFM